MENNVYNELDKALKHLQKAMEMVKDNKNTYQNIGLAAFFTKCVRDFYSDNKGT